MKQVSNAYKLSMKSLLREQSFVEITFSQVDTAAATDGNWVSNGAQSYSEFDTLDYGYDYQESYAALELNRWALDGNTVIVPSSGTMYDGFVSSHMSNAEGKFTTPAVLTRAFSNPHTFPGITLTFDTRYQEWPDTVTVDFYLNGTVLESLNPPPLFLPLWSALLSSKKIVLKRLRTSRNLLRTMNTVWVPNCLQVGWTSLSIQSRKLLRRTTNGRVVPRSQADSFGKRNQSYGSDRGYDHSRYKPQTGGES